MRQIFRYEVPVDDKVHWHQCSVPLFVSSRSPGVVEFWAFPESDTKGRGFLVFGTGHRISDDGATYRGTAFDLGGRLVWHLFEVS